MTKEILRGPNGIRIELDSTEIFPADPGQGTPAMVYLGQRSATYWCAVDTGELDGEYALNRRDLQWLGEQDERVGAFLRQHGG